MVWSSHLSENLDLSGFWPSSAGIFHRFGNVGIVLLLNLHGNVRKSVRIDNRVHIPDYGIGQAAIRKFEIIVYCSVTAYHRISRSYEIAWEISSGKLPVCNYCNPVHSTV